MFITSPPHHRFVVAAVAVIEHTIQYFRVGPEPVIISIIIKVIHCKCINRWKKGDWSFFFFIFFFSSSSGSPSRGGGNGLSPRYNPTELAHSFLFCSCVCFCLMALSTVFHSINAPENFPALSLCSAGLISALLVISTIYLFTKVSLSPDIILCGDWA